MRFEICSYEKVGWVSCNQEIEWNNRKTSLIWIYVSKRFHMICIVFWDIKLCNSVGFCEIKEKMCEFLEQTCSEKLAMSNLIHFISKSNSKSESNKLTNKAESENHIEERVICSNLFVYLLVFNFRIVCCWFRFEWKVDQLVPIVLFLSSTLVVKQQRQLNKMWVIFS